MIFEKPLIILAMARSGSSLLAGLFHFHGVFFGNCHPPDKFNQKGYFENTEINPLMLRHYADEFGTHNVYERMQQQSPIDGWKMCIRNILDRQGYMGGAWGNKASLYHRTLWHKSFDHPFFLMPMRNAENMLASCMARDVNNTISKKDWEGIIDAEIDHAIEMCMDNMGILIDMDHIMDGRYDELETTMASFGIKMDSKRVDKFVDKNLWTK